MPTRRRRRSLVPPHHVAAARVQGTPIVLVENEVTVGGRYDDWRDVTGERYHFPNQYRTKVTEGRPFVYYRGVRRARGRPGQPEYFGAGIVGNVVSRPKRAGKYAAPCMEMVRRHRRLPALLPSN